MKLELDKFPTIKNLADDVREKALEYAAKLGARGPRPTTVLGTAVTLAKEWKSGRLPARPVAAPFLVQPRQGRWVIKRSTEPEPSHTFMKKDDAVRRAQELAKAAGAACFVFGPGGTLIERYEARTLAALTLAPEPAAAPEPEPQPIVEAPAVMQAVAAAPVVEAAIEAVAPSVVEVAVEAVAPPVVEVAVEAVAPPLLEAVVVAPATEAEAPALEDDELPGPSEATAGEEPIRVKKLANKWALIMGDGRTETHATQKKAVARAKALAKKLGRPVVVG